MTTHTATLFIRPIQRVDNAAIANIIRTVLTTYGFGKGSAAEDPELDDLTSYFSNPAINGAYYVISDDAGNIYGGGGLARLTDTAPEEKICEFQKFYLLPEIRGKGLGKKLMMQLIQEAKNLGYQTAYLESSSRLEAAIQLFIACGFTNCSKLGPADRHNACEIHMKKIL